MVTWSLQKWIMSMQHGFIVSIGTPTIRDRMECNGVQYRHKTQRTKRWRQSIRSSVHTWTRAEHCQCQEIQVDLTLFREISVSAITHLWLIWIPKYNIHNNPTKYETLIRACFSTYYFNFTLHLSLLITQSFIVDSCGLFPNCPRSCSWPLSVF